MAYTTINKSSAHFNTKLYTGTGSSQSITGVNFQPDLVWVKSRSNTSEQSLFDVVRGVNKRIRSNSDGVETTAGNSVTAFGSDGFTVVSHADVNTNNQTYASWNWKAGGSASSNTNGSITSNVSVNDTAGFSVVSYTGTEANATVGHGLSSAPSMIIFKELVQGYAWRVYHHSLANTQKLIFSTTAAVTTDAAAFNSTSPTSTVFSVGSSGGTNWSGAMIAYCFAEKQGYSKMGSYTGNGNVDGTFVYTGFKPAYVMIKKSSASGSGWVIVDTKRNPENAGATLRLLAQATSSESTDHLLDMLSNGFKIRDSDATLNTSGATFIYMAFAEAPLVGTNNVPCTAR